MRPLSRRLQVIFDLVPFGSKVADIGTDHAYLPIALSLSSKAEKIIACDIKEMPLKKAQENIKKFGANNIETRLGDGITPVAKGEADTVIVAGMGGDVISHILSCCDWIKDESVTLLLQPMTSAEILRKFLTENLFSIEKEVPLSDSGKVYTVIVAKFCGYKTEAPVGFYYTGLLTAESFDGKRYLEKQRKRIKDCISQISLIKGKEEETKEYTKILERIDFLLNV